MCKAAQLMTEVAKAMDEALGGGPASNVDSNPDSGFRPEHSIITAFSTGPQSGEITMSSVNAGHDSDERRCSDASKVRSSSIPEFHDILRERGILRAYIIYENGRFALSHEVLKPLQAFLELSHDFSRHEAIFIAPSPERFRTLLTAFVHDTRRGLAQGGLRLWRYDTVAAMLQDGLRLSQGMTRKNALAGLDWGGGKGIMPLPPYVQNVEAYKAEKEERKELFTAYGEFIASLDGVYYTAEDMGTGTDDMNLLLAANRFTTCIGVDRGGSGNPSVHTAWGVYRAMQAAWGSINGGNEDLKDVRIAVQGAGNVGGPLIRYLVQRAGARLTVADLAPEAIRAIGTHYPDVKIVSGDELMTAPVEIFAPCAGGGVLNRETIKNFAKSVRLVCGAANNQLGESQDAERLRERGIAYVPDYLCNRMGITNCADEWEGYLEEDVQLASERVYGDTLRVFNYAENVQVSTATAADRLADVAAARLHPLFKHRGRRIQDHLREIHWATLDFQKRTDAKNRKWYEMDEGERSKKTLFTPAAHESMIYRKAERSGEYSGDGPTIASIPISTAGQPHLGEFLSPLLMDVAARARFAESPRRIVGLDHGGAALQRAVEESLPYHRRDTTSADLALECADHHSRVGAEIRHQLAQSGIGFDADAWLDPMQAATAAVVERLYNRLKDSGRILRGTHAGWRCPQCATVVTASETHRPKESITAFLVRCPTTADQTLTAYVERVEYFPFAAGIAIRPNGQYAALAAAAINPYNGATLPVVVGDTRMPKGIDAEVIVPGSTAEHRWFCQQHGLPLGEHIYDNGKVRMPSGQTLDRGEAVKVIAERLGHNLDKTTIELQLVRCNRCESRVDPEISQQTLLDLRADAKELRRLIDANVVRFSSRHATCAVIDQLDALHPTCISRQSVWGNPIPEGGGDVLSPWFSMAALTLQAAGWPERAAPDPIDTVFVDVPFLGRWVVPAQLIALAVCGRPAFKRVHVHGSVHIVTRSNEEIEPEATLDELRFSFRTVESPMEHRAGNFVEPASLIQRFGADALRLWYLLSLRPPDNPRVVLREEQAVVARRAIRRLNVALSFLLESRPAGTGEPKTRIIDDAVVAKLESLAVEARQAYATERFYHAARAFVEAVERAGVYARMISSAEGGARTAAAAATTIRIMRILEGGFAPVCPFIIGHFAGEVNAADVWPGQTYGWLADLVSLLSRGSSRAEFGTPDDSIRTAVRAHRDELQELLGAHLTVVDKPPRGRVQISGPFVRVDPGKAELPPGSDPVSAWYRSLHEGTPETS